jgi:hypothetical protein
MGIAPSIHILSRTDASTTNITNTAAHEAGSGTAVAEPLVSERLKLDRQS